MSLIPQWRLSADNPFPAPEVVNLNFSIADEWLNDTSNSPRASANADNLQKCFVNNLVSIGIDSSVYSCIKNVWL